MRYLIVGIDSASLSSLFSSNAAESSSSATRLDAPDLPSRSVACCNHTEALQDTREIEAIERRRKEDEERRRAAIKILAALTKSAIRMAEVASELARK